jgi:hypothetical protein
VTPDYEQAERYLRLLDPKAEQFTFQTFDDDEARKARTLARILHTTARDTTLQYLHERGAGAYVTINQTDGMGRCIPNIVRIRAVWQEDDVGFKGEFPLPPSLVVESSQGRFHRYWLVADGWPADDQGRLDFEGVMARIVSDYGSDKQAKDLSRVLRMPGFLNRKRKKSEDAPRCDVVRIVEVYRHYTRAQIMTAFPALEKRRPTISERASRPFTAPHQIEGIIRFLLRAPEGKRNGIAFWAACRLAGYDELSRDAVVALITEAGTRIGLTARELTATAKSALRTVGR